MILYFLHPALCTKCSDLERTGRRASPVTYLAQPTFLREKASHYRRLQRLHQSLRSFCSFEPHCRRLSRWKSSRLVLLPLQERSQRSTCHGPYTASILYCRTNIHEKRVRLPDQYPLRKFYACITHRYLYRLLQFVHCMYVLVELAFTYQTILALSAKLTKATTKVHTGCHLPIYIPFLLELCPHQKICETSRKIISLK